MSQPFLHLIVVVRGARERQFGWSQWNGPSARALVWFCAGTRRCAKAVKLLVLDPLLGARRRRQQVLQQVCGFLFQPRDFRVKGWNVVPQSGHEAVNDLSAGDGDCCRVGGAWSCLFARLYLDKAETPTDGLAFWAISLASTKVMMSLIGRL